MARNVMVSLPVALSTSVPATGENAVASRREIVAEADPMVTSPTNDHVGVPCMIANSVDAALVAAFPTRIYRDFELKSAGVFGALPIPEKEPVIVP